MAVLMTSEMPGVTQVGYDRLAEALLPVLRSTDGFIAHAAGPVDGGFRVSELWESEAAYESWFKAHVAPTMPADAPPPKVTFRPIANVVVA